MPTSARLPNFPSRVVIGLLIPCLNPRRLLFWGTLILVAAMTPADAFGASRNPPRNGAGSAARTASNTLTVGVVSWDVSFAGNAGEFDISNNTGPNSLPPDFPIITTLHLSNLNLLVQFNNGPAVQYDSSYFTLASDGLSFNGNAIPIGGTNPLPVSATLTGSFSPTTIEAGGATNTILSTFSATIADMPNLVNGDSGFISAALNSETSAPDSPTGLQAAGASTAASISWDAVVNASSYTVYGAILPSVSSSNATIVKSVTTISTTVDNLTNGVTYYFVVSASNAYGESAPSAVVSAMPAASRQTIAHVKVYPSPWRSDRGYPAHITFDQLPGNTTIKIFTVSGHHVKTLNTNARFTTWDLTNDSGDQVASGIYLYIITDGQGDKVIGKVGVIK